MSLRCIYKSHKTKEHAVSVIEAIRKEISRRSGIDNSKIIARLVNVNVKFQIFEGDKIKVEFLFVNLVESDIWNWIEESKVYFAEHAKRSEGLSPNNFELIIISDLAPLTLPKKPDTDEICLNFRIPQLVNPGMGKWKGCINESELISLLEKRIFKLTRSIQHYHKGDDDFRVIPYYWEQNHIPHNSKTQPGDEHWIKGFEGPVFIKGNFSNLWPIIALCAELNDTFGKGYFTIELNKSVFSHDFSSVKEMIHAILEASQNYDWLNEDPVFINKRSNIQTYANELCHLLKSNFAPEPNVAFYIEKQSGGTRLIEKPSTNELIIQFYLYKKLQPYFERIFEDESIGFRKGTSVNHATKLIEQAVTEGYEFVFETDIEDFFPNINHEKLKELLTFYLPAADSEIKRLLFALVETGYVLDGNYYPRTIGLAQGSVLSPMLANLYLDSFDELVKNEDVRLVRFADDFVVMTKTREQAEQIKMIVTDALIKIKLQLKSQKTSVKHISEGFTFLGISFTPEGAQTIHEQDYRLLKKPLYINQPYTLLKLNGDAVNIVKDKKVFDTIPLRRINSILLLESSSISTMLIKKCTDLNIPLTITQYGYFVNTISAQAKNFYNTSAKHYETYKTLTPVEKLFFAKEFAMGKIINLQTMFRQRYVKKDKDFHKQQEFHIYQIQMAGTIEQLLGLEGNATKEIYAKMNSLINNHHFIMTKRDRFGVDPMNSLLNFASYLLFTLINVEMRTCGLNPYLGFLHSENDRYESFAADVEELFRCFTLRLILRVINLKIITETDFVLNRKQRLYLTDSARKKFLLEFEKMMLHSINGFTVRDHIHRQMVFFKIWAEDCARPNFFRWQ